MITWDFDIIKGDVIFTVFRHKRPKEACSGSLTSLGESPSCGVIANVDAVVVEKPKTCHDGDSIQVGGCGRRRGLKEVIVCVGRRGPSCGVINNVNAVVKSSRKSHRAQSVFPRVLMYVHKQESTYYNGNTSHVRLLHL